MHLQSPEMRAILRQYLTRLAPIHPARYYFCAENTSTLYKDQQLDEDEMGECDHDALLTDTFLHSQDRAYTVLQLRDELCAPAGMALTSWADPLVYEPGNLPHNPHHNAVYRISLRDSDCLVAGVHLSGDDVPDPPMPPVRWAPTRICVPTFNSGTVSEKIVGQEMAAAVDALPWIERSAVAETVAGYIRTHTFMAMRIGESAIPVLRMNCPPASASMAFEGLGLKQLQIKIQSTEWTLSKTGGAGDRAVAPTGLTLPPLVDLLVGEMDGTRTIGGVIDAVMLQLTEAIAAGNIVDTGAHVTPERQRAELKRQVVMLLRTLTAMRKVALVFESYPVAREAQLWEKLGLPPDACDLSIQGVAP